MRPTRLRSALPFVGLLALSGFVASVAGVGGAITTTTPTSTQLTAPTLPSPKLGIAEPMIAPEGDPGVVPAQTAASTASNLTIDPGWNAPVPLKNFAGRTTNCGSDFSGGSDAAGRVYHACKHAIHVRGAKGALKTVISTGESAPVGRRDVAPNAEGTLVYYTVGERQDTDLTSAQLAAGWGQVHRMELNAAGKWVRDTTFSVGPISLDGQPWSMRYLTVGPDGVLYASVNQFIYAFDTTGHVRADQFGQYDAAGTRIGDPIASWIVQPPAVGYNVVEGLAMSADGAYLFATEEDYDYLTRFARNAAGAWVADKIAGVPKSTVDSCDAPYLKAPYDVAVTHRGLVLVTNTTCGEVRTYSLDLVAKGSALKGLGFLPHGLAVAGNGAIILPWRNEIYTRR
jgi:hypothetical protein